MLWRILHNKSIFLGAVLSVLLSACTGVGRYYVSRIDMNSVDNGALDASGVITMPELDIMVRPTNHVIISSGIAILFFNHYREAEYDWNSLSSPYYEHDSLSGEPSVFYMEINLSPKTDEVYLEVKNIVLKVDGLELSPESFYGPVALNSKGNYRLPLCRVDFDTPENTPSRLNFTQGKSFCIAVKFGIPPPPPNNKFSISLGEFSVKGKRTRIPEIEFGTKVEEYYKP